MKKDPLDKIIHIIRNYMTEEVPTNNASSGSIAGLPPDQPPMYSRKRYAKGGKNSRKIWLDFLKNK